MSLVSDRSPITGSDLVLGLAEVDAGMLLRVGGKAANLGALTQAGFAVPQGFCVTTEAYRQVLEAAGADVAAAAPDPGDSNGIAELAGRMRDLIVNAPVPDRIRRNILDAYATMGSRVQVAVRSSATAEDLPFASFAGQQDTYLGILGADQLIDAVRRCWASLWTDRAVSYRTAQNIDHRTARLAVVVQTMVDSAVAGVLFTANPVTGRRREAVIDASPGLGESVVSGAVTPDHYVVDVASGRILQSRAGDHQTAIRTLPAGGTEKFAATAGVCLTDQQVLALAQLGDRVEQHYGAPQDIEWAIDADGKLWLTQSRPITTLFPLPDRLQRHGLRVYFCFSVAQGLYRPLTPMGLAAIRLLASGAAHLFGAPESTDWRDGPPLYAEAGQRVFLDLTGVLRSRVGREFMPRVFDLMETRSATIMRSLFARPEFSITQRSVLPAAKRLARLGFRFRVPVYLIQAVVSPATAHRRVHRLTADLRAGLAVPPGAGPTERLDHAEDLLFRQGVPQLPRVIPAALAGLAMLGLAARLLRGDAKPGDLPGVLRGIPHNVTTDMDLELWALAQRVRGEAAVLLSTSPDVLAARFRTGELPAVLQDGLTRFLAEYGDRAVAEIDLGIPRWSDDPTHIIGVLANYLRVEDSAAAPSAMFARGDREARATIDRLGALAARRGRWRGRVVRFALGRTRELVGIREMPKYHLVLLLGAARRDLTAVGAALAADGRIDDVDDVFFLSMSEARAGLSGQPLQAVVTDRRESYEQEMRRRRVPRVLLSDGTEPENTGAAGDITPGALVGVAASPGEVTGVARVILDPVGAELAPGEILVAPSTDPGWTPLFLTAGGLVMEMGGANSHGAVVAREYGIPAVVGVPLATERVSTGDALTVNGTLGTVEIHTETG